MNYLDILKKYDKAIVTESKKLHGIYESLLKEGKVEDEEADNKEAKKDKDEDPVEECDDADKTDEVEDDNEDNSDDGKKTEDNPKRVGKDGMLTREEFFKDDGENDSGVDESDKEDGLECEEDTDEDVEQVEEFFAVSEDDDDTRSDKEDKDDNDEPSDEDSKKKIDEDDTSKLAMKASDIFAEDEETETEDDAEEDGEDETDDETEDAEEEDDSEDVSDEDTEDDEDDSEDDDPDDKPEDEPKKKGKKKVKGESEVGFKNAKEWLASEGETTDCSDEECKKPKTESEKKSITQIMEKDACAEGADNEDDTTEEDEDKEL